VAPTWIGRLQAVLADKAFEASLRFHRRADGGGRRIPWPAAQIRSGWSASRCWSWRRPRVPRLPIRSPRRALEFATTFSRAGCTRTAWCPSNRV